METLNLPTQILFAVEFTFLGALAVFTAYTVFNFFYSKTKK